MKRYCLFFVVFLMAFVSFLPMLAGASVLGTAGEFNTFIFGDYACTSDAEGRVAVGGNMTVSSYSVADKLTPAEVAKYVDTLIVGGNLTFTNGRVYYGNILVGGSAAGVSSSVISGLAAGAQLIAGEPVPIDFTAEKTYLRSLSAQLAQLPANGKVEERWSGGFYLIGDGTSALQVFNLNGTKILSANTFIVENIPTGATVLFNISGASAGLKNMSMESLTSFQNTTLYNFYQATTLQLSGIAVRGSVLAPFAVVNNPQGVIWGTIIAASWNGMMQQNHVPFTGEIDSVVIKLNDNKDSQYKITFVERDGNTWTYKVEELKGRSLSHWDLGISSCLNHITGYTPTTGFSQGTDGSTGFIGIKWDLADKFTSGNFSFTLDSDYPEDIVEVLAKAGSTYAIGNITGPNCESAPQPPAEPSCELFLNGISAVSDGNPWTSDEGNTAWWTNQNGETDTITVNLENITFPVTYRWQLSFPTDHSKVTELMAGYEEGTMVYNKGEGEFTSGGTYNIDIPYPSQGQWGAPSLDGYGTYESHVTLWISGPCDDQNWDHWYKAPWQSDLSVTKTAPAQAEVGDTLTYMITVTNNGPQNSQVYEGRGVKLTDALPAGVTLLSVIPSQGSCDQSVACDLGAINYLQSATVEVQVKVGQAGTITNTATVSPERPGDSNLENNTASVETTVIAPQTPETPKQDVLLIGINDDLDRFEIYNTATKEKSFPKAFEIVIMDSGERQRVEAQKVPDEIDSLVYVSEGTYYGIQSFENPEGTSQLYKFTLNHDTTEITIEKIGQPFSGTDIDSIEYGDGVFYAMDNNTHSLLVIDMNGNLISSTNLSDLGLTNVAGLAYKDGLLYASDTNAENSSLFRINVMNGLDNLFDSSIQYIGQIGYGQVGALTFVDDILYGASDLQNSLFSIDLGTGFGTFMDNWGTAIEGIAVVHPGATAAVPEPGTLVLIGLGILGIHYVRRKR
ncbi:von Willebrand factor type A domain protein [Candidatus Vecturithrix granuli]|uniref:von Willebrand factor type A domain protein n=1 Tax=Vecturithrix granuli TaxID=1499967 RepID=A0A081C1Q5_VECG1|nr:von Willebrand factor type A domain protein [Candidatus Vecturithrix granuli]